MRLIFIIRKDIMRQKTEKLLNINFGKKENKRLNPRQKRLKQSNADNRLKELALLPTLKY